MGQPDDAHQHVINLARVLSHQVDGPWLIRQLRRIPFHTDAHRSSQAHAAKLTPLLMDRQAALDYFVAVWMGRSAKAGVDDEFNGRLSVRWNPAGGDSCIRYRNAIESLQDWRRVLSRWTFECMDAFAFLDKCHDMKGHGLYVDAPWPGDGDGYKHKFLEAQQRKLAATICGFDECRVVVRFGDHPLIRELYAERLGWTWNLVESRTQANKAKAEVLLTRNCQ